LFYLSVQQQQQQVLPTKPFHNAIPFTQTYFLPFPRTRSSFFSNDRSNTRQSNDGDGCTSDVVTVVATYEIIATADNTVVSFDHWEDGYDDSGSFDVVGFTASSSTTTEVWGDDDSPSYGVPSSGRRRATVGEDAAGVVRHKLMAGDVIRLGGRNSSISDKSYKNNYYDYKYDGGDRIQSNFPVAVTATIAINKATGCENTSAPSTSTTTWTNAPVGDTTTYGTYYIIPSNVGLRENYVKDASSSSINSTIDEQGDLYYVMAAEDETVVVVTFPNGSNEDAAVTKTLRMGETWFVHANATAATVGQQQAVVEITSDKPVRVDVIARRHNNIRREDTEAVYADSGWISVLPYDDWGHEYVVPFSERNRYSIFLYNPGRDTIQINCTETASSPDNATASTLIAELKANDKVVLDIPTRTGAVTSIFLRSKDFKKFLCFVTMTTEGPAASALVPVMPSGRLTPQILVEWGTSEKYTTRSIVIAPFRQPAGGAYAHVDWNNDGIIDSVIPIRPFHAVKIVAPDRAQASNESDRTTVATVYGTEMASIDSAPVQITAVLDSMDEHSNVIVPITPFRVTQSVKLVDDRDGNQAPSSGDVLEHVIVIQNFGPTDIQEGELIVNCPYLHQTQYVVGTFSYLNIRRWNATDTTNTVKNNESFGSKFPLSGKGLTSPAKLHARGGMHLISFHVAVHDDAKEKLFSTGTVTHRSLTSKNGKEQAVVPFESTVRLLSRPTPPPTDTPSAVPSASPTTNPPTASPSAAPSAVPTSSFATPRPTRKPTSKCTHSRSLLASNPQGHRKLCMKMTPKKEMKPKKKMPTRKMAMMMPKRGPVRPKPASDIPVVSPSPTPGPSKKCSETSTPSKADSKSSKASSKQSAPYSMMMKIASRKNPRSSKDGTKYNGGHKNPTKKKKKSPKRGRFISDSERLLTDDLNMTVGIVGIDGLAGNQADGNETDVVVTGNTNSDCLGNIRSSSKGKGGKSGGKSGRSKFQGNPRRSGGKSGGPSKSTRGRRKKTAGGGSGALSMKKEASIEKKKKKKKNGRFLEGGGGIVVDRDSDNDEVDGSTYARGLSKSTDGEDPGSFLQPLQLLWKILRGTLSDDAYDSHTKSEFRILCGIVVCSSLVIPLLLYSCLLAAPWTPCHHLASVGGESGMTSSVAATATDANTSFGSTAVVSSCDEDAEAEECG